MKKLMLLAVIGMIGLISKAGVIIPNTVIPYNVNYHWAS